jgi:hypothetical protein
MGISISLLKIAENYNWADGKNFFPTSLVAMSCELISIRKLPLPLKERVGVKGMGIEGLEILLP